MSIEGEVNAAIGDFAAKLRSLVLQSGGNLTLNLASQLAQHGVFLPEYGDRGTDLSTTAKVNIAARLLHAAVTEAAASGHEAPDIGLVLEEQGIDVGIRQLQEGLSAEETAHGNSLAQLAREREENADLREKVSELNGALAAYRLSYASGNPGLDGVAADADDAAEAAV